MTDLSCHFTRLPAEIRNLIYDYALYEPLGLLVIRGPDDVSRLCLQFQQQGHTTWDSSLSVVNTRKITMVKGKVPRGFGQWQLFDAQVANQLQFVSRSFRHETKGYGLRLNSITFTSVRNGDYGVLPQFRDFMMDLPKPRYKHLSTVVLRDRAGGAMNCRWDRDAVIRICRKNPHILVKIYEGLTIMAESEILFKALEIKQVFRRDPGFVMRITSDPVLQQQLLSIQQPALSVVPRLPANLRLFPANETFDAQAFHQLFMKDYLYSFFMSKIPGGFDSWIPWIEDWYKNGF